MSPSASIDFRSALQVSPERIARLKEPELGELMGQLLRAQSHRCGAPASELRINTEEKAADGGADAWSGKPEKDDKWLGDAETCWQLKAGTAGNPAAVRGEVGKELPRDTLQKGGRFVLVASGSTSGKKGEDARLKTLIKEAEAAGLPTDRIAVFGSEKLTEWVNQHPAIAARWANRPDGLWSFREWPAQKEHETSWQAIDDLNLEIATYRQELDPTTVQPDNGCLHLHLHGPPGSGKTRLALEICKEAPWADFIVYVQRTRASNVLALLTQAASEESVRCVVVADDTPADLLIHLRDALERSEGRIRLITLGSRHSPDTRRIKGVELPPLSTHCIQELVGCWSPAMPAELVQMAVNLAAGNPRLARLAADALTQNPALNSATLNERPEIRDLRADIASHQKPKGRSDWIWPQPWDFTLYRSGKRQGFVGRQWLFEEVRAWATNPKSEQALLIGADYGVGKSAFLAELLDTGAAGLPVVAHHFCRADISDTLEAGRFVRSLASQLAEALPAYRALLEADDAKELRDKLDQADQKPLPAFDQAVLAPLLSIEAPATQLLLVIDALDEAVDPGVSADPPERSTTPSIVQLLASYSQQLPPWVKVLATSRRREDLLTTLQEAFILREINAEEGRNLSDLCAYARARCDRSPLAERLASADLTATETAEFLSCETQSGGKFLYVTRVLGDLEKGLLPLANRNDLEKLPPGLDKFYLQTFERRFPNTGDYSLVQLLLGLLCAQREPLGHGDLAAILDVSVDQIAACLLPLEDLLRFHPSSGSGSTSSTETNWRISIDHVSLKQWLTERSGGKFPRARAGRFAVDRAAAAKQIRTWALAEVQAGRAHTWPYLVRHLASHLNDVERAEVIGGQLLQLPWLQARLKLAGLTALLGDFNPTQYAPQSLPPAVTPLERALRLSAHVLSHEDGWTGQEQLASQLLARLPDGAVPQGLEQQMRAWLHKAGGARPRAASLVGHGALLGTLPVGSGVQAVVQLPDGRLAAGCSDGRIRLWDPASGSCTAVFEGHGGSVNALAVLADGRLASGSRDNTIRLWDPASGACSAVFEGHGGSVNALAVLADGRLASGSGDTTIRLWDPASGDCSAVFEGHGETVWALAVLADGRLASGSSDTTIRLWDPASGACSAVFEGHGGWVWSLAVLADGRLASGSRDSTIRLWDPASGDCSAVFEGHRGWVMALAVLADGRLASGSRDTTIRLWDPASGACSAVFEGHRGAVMALAVLADGRLASGSSDTTIRLWDPASGACSAVFEGHGGSVNALAVLADGRLASGSRDTTIRLWDPASGDCSAVFEGHGGWVWSLAVLADGRLASGSDDSTIRLWDPASGDCSAVFEGHGETVWALAVLADGRLASGSRDTTIRLWDPASGACSAVFEGHGGWVGALAVLADGRLASGSRDTTIRLWDPASGDCSAVFEGHRGWVMALAVLADGRLASGSSDTTIRLWDPASGACSAVFEGHRGWVRSLAVLADGRLASGSDDHTIRLWDPARPDGAPRVLFVADAAITALAWVPSHQLLVAGDASGRLHWLELGPHG